jgi:putative transposase
MRKSDTVKSRTRRNLVMVSVHIIWTTWQRQPYLTKARERRAYRCITAEAQKLGATVLAVNGMPDHVHLIILQPPTLCLSKLMNQIKGVSSHLLTAETPEEGPFVWADGYAAFSMSRDHRDAAVAYVKRQKQHHAGLSLKRGWETVPEDTAP